MFKMELRYCQQNYLRKKRHIAIYDFLLHSLKTNDKTYADKK